MRSYRGKNSNNEWEIGSLVIKNGFYGIMEDADSPWIVVDPNTIGQLTGFVDVDGYPLYEGDIILVPSSDGKTKPTAHTIDFSNGAFGYWTIHNENYSFFTTLYSLLRPSKMEFVQGVGRVPIEFNTDIILVCNKFDPLIDEDDMTIDGLKEKEDIEAPKEANVVENSFTVLKNKKTNKQKEDESLFNV